MPIYEYRCGSCGFQKDHLQKLSDPVLTTCPDCGGRVTRTRHTFDVHIGRRTVAVEGEYARCTGACAS